MEHIIDDLTGKALALPVDEEHALPVDGVADAVGRVLAGDAAFVWGFGSIDGHVIGLDLWSGGSTRRVDIGV